MTHWNRVFWAVFIVLGAIIIAGSIVHILFLDVIFGLLVIGVGAAKLGEEITDRRLQRSHSVMNQSISYLTRQVDSASSVTEHIKDNSDSRFFRTDRRFHDMEDKMESDYNSLAKKIISLENRTNEHSKLMLEIAKRQEALKAKQEQPIAAAPKPQIFVPRTSVVPEKRIMRFSLPKIAPKAAAVKIKKPKTRGRKTIRAAAGKTVINISAPMATTAKKVRVKPTTRPRAGAKKTKPALKKPLKAKALKRNTTKKVAKNISINIA